MVSPPRELSALAFVKRVTDKYMLVKCYHQQRLDCHTTSDCCMAAVLDPAVVGRAMQHG